MSRFDPDMRRPRTATASNRSARSGPRAAAASAGPTARASHERYLALARAKALAGDQIEAERCYQYAEHYLRLMRETAA